MKKKHNKILKVNIFDKVIETLKTLKRIKSDRFTFNTNTVITNSNYKEIEEMAEFIQNNLKVNAGFETVRGERQKKSPFLPPDEEMEKLFEKLKIIYSKNIKDPILLYTNYQMLKTELYINKHNKIKYKCFAGKGLGVIYPDGYISVCELFPPYANLKDYNWNFKKAWFSLKAKKARKKVKGCFCTHGCWLSQNILLSPKEMFKFHLSNNK